MDMLGAFTAAEALLPFIKDNGMCWYSADIRRAGVSFLSSACHQAKESAWAL